MLRYLTLAAAVAPAAAFWRMECRGVAGYYRMDPIVSPGEASSHLHSILGSGGFSESASYDDLTGSDCTSCLVTQDKSAYWHPALYFQDASTGEFELVGQTGGTLAYYLLYTGNGNTNITAFPEGFRMIAGDQTRRAYTAGNVEMVDPPKSDWAALGQTDQDTLAQRALGFNCLDYSADAEASLWRHFFPGKSYLDANCPDGIRFELMFPSCWNGVDLDSDNHRDHMAYPDEVMTGDCPDGYLTRVPSLFYETIWDTASFQDRDGEFVIANGDMEGFAYHGDFMTGWDVDLLQDAIETCTNASGEISDCPLFDIQSLADAQSCTIPEPDNLSGDNVDGPASILPGGVAVFGSAIDATMIATYNSALATTVLGTEQTVGGAAAAAATTTAAAGTTTSVASSAAASATAEREDGLNNNAAAVEESSTVAPSSSVVAAVSSVVAAVSSSVAAAVPTSSVLSVAAVPTSSAAAAAVTSSTPVAIPSSTFSTAVVVTLSQAISSTTTVLPATTTAAPVDEGAIRTEYITSNGVVTEFLWYEATVYETEDVTSTVTTTIDSIDKRHVHNHMRRHGNWRRQHNH